MDTLDAVNVVKGIGASNVTSDLVKGTGLHQTSQSMVSSKIQKIPMIIIHHQSCASFLSLFGNVVASVVLLGHCVRTIPPYHTYHT